MLKKEALLGQSHIFSHVIICITPRTMRTINTFLMVPHLEKEKANITLFLGFFPAREAHIFFPENTGLG